MYVFLCISVSVHVSVCACMCVCVLLCMSCVGMYMYLFMCVCACISVYMYVCECIPQHMYGVHFLLLLCELWDSKPDHQAWCKHLSPVSHLTTPSAVISILSPQSRRGRILSHSPTSGAGKVPGTEEPLNKCVEFLHSVICSGQLLS